MSDFRLEHPSIAACEYWGYPTPETPVQCELCDGTAHWWDGRQALCDACARQQALEELNAMDTDDLCVKMGYEVF